MRSSKRSRPRPSSTAARWSGQLEDAEAHLEQGVELARRIGRPYIEMGCLAHLGPAAYLRSFAQARQRCEEAIAIADAHSWGTEPFLGVALVVLGGIEVWAGRFAGHERDSGLAGGARVAVPVHDRGVRHRLTGEARVSREKGSTMDVAMVERVRAVVAA